MPPTEQQYVCAVSGVAADPATDRDAELDDLPVGWARVVVSVRTDNPDFLRMREAREVLITQQLAAAPEDKREAARPLATMIARATFAALEVQTPRYVITETEVYVCAEQIPMVLELIGEGPE